MTKDQVTAAFAKAGVSTTDLAQIRSELYVIWNDNNAHFINQPSDVINELLEFDFTNEIVVLKECVHGGRMVKTVQGFDNIQKLVFKDRTDYSTQPVYKDWWKPYTE